MKCEQCGKEMGYEWLLCLVCGKCCRVNQKNVLNDLKMKKEKRNENESSNKETNCRIDR